MRCAPVCVFLLSLAATGCSHLPSDKQPAIYAFGDKAPVGPLTYTVTDTETTQQLGDDPNVARTAQDRFYLVGISVSNSSADEQTIPGMALVDDQGKSYGELADGANVPNWLGVARKVGVAQIEKGYVVFDAPAKHYRLRLTDPVDEKEIAIDVPLDFVHDQLKTILATPNPASELSTPIDRQ
jgi:hypothetical protein